MFGMTGPDLPYRSRKDLARAQQLRGLTRRRTGLASPPIDNMWMPMLSHDFWRRDFLGGGGGGIPLSGLPNRFEELDNHALPRPMSSSGGDYGPSYAKDTQKRGAGGYTYRETVPFDKAADALCQALHFAIKHCKGIREHFGKEVENSSISLWAPPKVIDALWGMNLEWNGVDLALLDKNPNTQPSPEVVTFKSVSERLFGALEGIKISGRPRLEELEERGSKLSPEVVRTTIMKLKVTMQGVEELMQSVRKSRALIEPLVKEMMAATALLGDIEDLWRPSGKGVGGKARARWEDEDFVWPDYRGE